MSMRKIYQVIVLLAGVAASPEYARSGWIDHQNWSERWGASRDSYLVTHFGESPVRSTFRGGSEPFTAEGEAVIFPGTTTPEVSSALLQALTPKLAVQTAETRTDVSLESAWLDTQGVADRVSRQEHESWRSTLKTLAVRLQPLKALRLSAGPYNRVPKRNGYSVATFLLFDGKDLFGSSCTLLVAYRTDRVRQWGWRSIHDPFSFGYEPRTIDIITSTETAFIKRTGQLLGRDMAELSFPYARTWYSDPELWRTLKFACQAPHAVPRNRREVTHG
jgi:hypothetical protein